MFYLFTLYFIETPIFKIAFFLSLVLTGICPAYSQNPQKYITQEQQIPVGDSILSKTLANKQFPEHIKLPFMWAVVAYPELYDTKISIRFKKIRSTGAARPVLGSLFRCRSNRK